ncbi:hypothetical protein Tco_0071601 [Tanacetum coccineum]
MGATLSGSQGLPSPQANGCVSVAGSRCSRFPEGSSLLLTFDVQRHSADMCRIFKYSSQDSRRLDVAAKFLFQSSRYVVPTGRVVVPTGRYVVPAGKVIIIVSTGRLCFLLVVYLVLVESNRYSRIRF